MTRTTAPTRACAAAIAVALPLAAPAAPANAQAAIFELSSGSSRGSSEHNYRIDPNDPSIQVPDQPALGSAYTGAAPVSLALAIVIPLVTAQFIVDAVPALRQTVDGLAAQYGLQNVRGSSEGNRIFDVPALLDRAAALSDRALSR